MTSVIGDPGPRSAATNMSVRDIGSEKSAFHTIAVIGGGGAGISFVHHFVMALTPEQARNTRIVLFEPRSSIGPGLAYQDDSEALLLNRASDGMSASAEEPSTFSSWLRWKAHHVEDLKTLSDSDQATTFAARPVFGRFLTDFFIETKSRARAKGLNIEVVHDAVEAVERGCRYAIVLSQATYEVDRVVLAIGNPRQRDHYGLIGHAGYVNDPYPLRNHLPSLVEARRVCIIGTSLAAVDVAMALERSGYEGEVDMVSPNGALPFVRGSSRSRHILRHITRASLDQVTSGGRRKVGPRSLLRLLRRELREIAFDWRTLFRPDVDPVQALRDGIHAAHAVVPWQRVLASTNDIVEEAWHALDEAGQILFLERYHRRWMARRAPMPLENARRLLAMLDDGRLRLHSGILTFESYSSGSPIEAVLPSGECRAYDYVVNATGAARWADAPEDLPLAWRLMRDGLATRDPRGGLRVDFATNALIDANGEADPNVRLLGHLTCGTYLFVTSLEMIARRARNIALDMTADLSVASYDDHPMSLAA